MVYFVSYDLIIRPNEGEIDPALAHILDKEILVPSPLHALANPYKNFTSGGSEWLAMYPPDVPKQPIW